MTRTPMPLYDSTLLGPLALWLHNHFGKMIDEKVMLILVLVSWEWVSECSTYIYRCVRIYVCMTLCVCVLYVCMYACMYACMYVCMYVCMHVYSRVYSNTVCEGGGTVRQSIACSLLSLLLLSHQLPSLSLHDVHYLISLVLLFIPPPPPLPPPPLHIYLHRSFYW